MNTITIPLVELYRSIESGDYIATRDVWHTYNDLMGCFGGYYPISCAPIRTDTTFMSLGRMTEDQALQICRS
jgi:hypothetical protein